MHESYVYGYSNRDHLSTRAAMRAEIQSRVLLAALFAVAATLLSSCTAVVNTIESAFDVRSAGEVVDDNVLIGKINAALLRDSDLWADVNTAVFQRHVLLAGSVQTREAKKRAGGVVRGIDGVQEIINELQITDEGGFSQTAEDFGINTKVKFSLARREPGAQINYRWKSVDGVVYFLGEAENEAERDRVFEVARGVEGVERIIDHVWVKEEGFAEIGEPGSSEAIPTSQEKPKPPGRLDGLYSWTLSTTGDFLCEGALFEPIRISGDTITTRIKHSQDGPFDFRSKLGQSGRFKMSASGRHVTIVISGQMTSYGGRGRGSVIGEVSCSGDWLATKL